MNIKAIASVVIPLTFSSVNASEADHLINSAGTDPHTSEWIFPSKDEQYEINNNLHGIGLGGFGSQIYWHSSGFGNIFGWNQLFDNNNQIGKDENDTNRIHTDRPY